MNLINTIFICIMTCMFSSPECQNEAMLQWKTQNTMMNAGCQNIEDTVVFIGDSRTVGMQVNCPDGLYICKCGEGYRWLVSEEISQSVDQAVRSSDIFVR